MYSEKPKLQERHKTSKQGTLRTIALDVTPRCNMRCDHCYAETYRHVDAVSLDVLQRTLDELFELGVFHYVLQGGEPITDPARLHAIVEMCHPDETYINVVTNGWDMTLDNIRWLRAIKVDKIAFSLDSGMEKEHDANRLPGSYRRVMAAIDNVLNEGLLASISTVVTHRSLYSEGFRKALALAKKKKIRMDVQIAEPVGKWDGRKDNLITREDAAYIKNLQLTSGVLPNGQKLINRDIFCGDHDHCPAGTEFMAISSNGCILPCNFLQFSLGNIGDKSVKEMRDALLTCEWFDGKHPSCICGEDDLFIDGFIVPYVDEPKPLDACTVFGLN